MKIIISMAFQKTLPNLPVAAAACPAPYCCMILARRASGYTAILLYVSICQLAEAVILNT